MECVVYGPEEVILDSCVDIPLITTIILKQNIQAHYPIISAYHAVTLFLSPYQYFSIALLYSLLVP